MRFQCIPQGDWLLLVLIRLQNHDNFFLQLLTLYRHSPIQILDETNTLFANDEVTNLCTYKGNTLSFSMKN